MFGPFFRNRSFWILDFKTVILYAFKWWKIAINIKPKGIIIENPFANNFNAEEYLLLNPTDWKDEENHDINVG